ncbi:hypothetical protein P43SY_004224 [Pythium insidiosum]|uniref:EF-hand domain-containing protein n=1 Tax=Pythium insidiosum TaxID=114742 RepID=A0AAD5Q7E6_PYTIN|nr:hypothetical protein P43SY_004224 [Pythium insidiosum]
MLNVNLTIQELDLSWNMLRFKSAAPIANALQLNYNLCELNLSYNGCGDQAFVAEHDYDKSGALGFEEFEDLFWRCGFAMVDSDNSGALNSKEVDKVLRLMGFDDVSEREIQSMMAKYDVNNSGEIDEAEFIEFMKGEFLQGRHSHPACLQKMTMCTMIYALSIVNFDAEA